LLVLDCQDLNKILYFHCFIIELFDKNIDIFGFEHGENIVRDKSNLPYERNPSSLACVNYGDERKYIIGGFYGGNTKRMIEVFSLLNNNVDKDLQNNIIAKFHDESHMNNYFVNNKDTIIFSLHACKTKYNIIVIFVTSIPFHDRYPGFI
jgi:hypothetical protein